MESEPTFTYQARFSVSVVEQGKEIFDSYADLLSRMERNLFADIAAKKNPSKLKSSYLVNFSITGRQFNSCLTQLEGKIASIKELMTVRIEALSTRIEKLEKKIPKIRNKKQAHQKKSTLASLKNKRQKLIEDQEEGRVRLCFGSKKLFRAQFDLKANNYRSHKEWLEDWQEERNNSFFLMGSKDETAGNQSCTAFIQQEGSLTLRLRLPDALAKVHGKYVEIPDVRFAYGHETVVAALHSCLERSRLFKMGDPSYKNYGQALSYRFKRDEKGWRVFVSTSLKEPEWISRPSLGAIGVDINADHLAVMETDRFGNPVRHKTIPLVAYGKTSEQTQAAIGDASAEIVGWAVQSKKPIVLENLDFKAKKSDLAETHNPRYARMLSSLAYSAINSSIRSRAYRHGIKVEEVNPAFTSVIGRVKFASRYGITVHEAAALCIARRFQELSERIPRSLDDVPDGKSGHVDLPVPERTLGGHVWKQWRQVRKSLQAALAAHFQAMKNRSSAGPPGH